MASRSKRKPEHYVNNKEFTAAVVEYAAQMKEAKEKEQEIPMIPEYIGDCFVRIAQGLSHKPNFYKYSWREDMVMDGVENCVKAIHNYDVDKKTRSGKPNAFAYFTQIIWFAFLRRIAKEKKQQEIKDKIKSSASIEDFLENDGDANGTAIIEKMRNRQDNF